MPAYRHAAHRVFNAAEINYTASGAATTTTRRQPAGQLPRAREPAGVSADRRLGRGRRPTPRSGGSSATSARRSPTWRTGRSRSRSRPLNSEADFNNDVVVRFKASERGAAAVINPRYVVKNYDT